MKNTRSALPKSVTAATHGLFALNAHVGYQIGCCSLFLRERQLQRSLGQYSSHDNLAQSSSHFGPAANSPVVRTVLLPSSAA